MVGKDVAIVVVFDVFCCVFPVVHVFPVFGENPGAQNFRQKQEKTGKTGKTQQKHEIPTKMQENTRKINEHLQKH